MRFPTRIRLLTLSLRRRRQLTYPTLVISVTDTEGHTWVTPSLGEAIVHLRSTTGARLRVEDQHRQREGIPGSPPHRTETTDKLVIDRTDDNQFVIRVLEAGPGNAGDNPPPWSIDMSIDPPIAQVGRMTCSTVEVLVDCRHSWASEDRFPLRQHTAW